MTTTDTFAPESVFAACRQIARDCRADGLQGHSSDFELGALQGAYRRIWEDRQRLRRVIRRQHRLASRRA
jgi:hypothetical protein